MVFGFFLLHLFNHRLHRFTLFSFSHEKAQNDTSFSHREHRDHKEKIKEIEPRITLISQIFRIGFERNCGFGLLLTTD